MCDEVYYLDQLRQLAELAELARLASVAAEECCVPIEVPQFGGGLHLLQELGMNDEETFHNCTRMNLREFDTLLSKIGSQFIKQSIKHSISPAKRLQMTLQYLATGDSFINLHKQFRIGYSTVISIVHDTLGIIAKTLESEIPNLSQENLQNISNEFSKKCVYPHIIGALDGKQLTIRGPPVSGKDHPNYRRILLAIADSEYKFIYFDVAAYDLESDGGIFRSSWLGQALDRGEIDLPESRPVNDSYVNIPYYFVGAETFPLCPYLMVPYSNENLTNDEVKHNKAHFRGRQYIENAFGVLATRWRVLLKPISMHPKNVNKMIAATILLHNYLLTIKSDTYLTPQYVDHFVDDSQVDGLWRHDESLPSIPGDVLTGDMKTLGESVLLRDMVKALII